jgi:predicted nucleotidyltransferase
MKNGYETNPNPNEIMTLPLAVEQEIVRRLRPLNPAKVILFGSYAKGTATAESDIDLAVVVPGLAAKTYAEHLDNLVPASRALRPMRKTYPMDVIVYTTGDYEYLKKQRDPFWREVESTGRVLYGR